MNDKTIKVKFQTLMNEKDVHQAPNEDNYYKYKGEKVCIDFDVGDEWMIFWADCDIIGEADDDLKEFAQQAENPCGNCDACPYGDRKGSSKRIFGKVIKNSCTSTLCFPDCIIDTEALEKIMRLVELRKKDIENKNNFHNAV